ncbi:ketosteroid isomerase-related protein [Tropicibacter alexandrii]|uniref:ketosteroid isomerase-related protein n=1 Tax=Tropicibacter alexandrii TaxID=2267683 RepID=UPI000EF54398|nr:ketosteroid isomerase-related protein [Tropicibacter alexandrii]
MTAKNVITRYFDAFNAGDTEAMLACLSPDIEHHVNEGNIRVGKVKFAEFCAHMSHCYAEQLTDMVIFASEDGTRGAAEFIVNGTYKATDAGLPEARGQTYRLPAGSFFSLKDGLITRVVTYYNLSDWIKQVS